VEQWQENLGVPISLGPALDWPSYLSLRDSTSPMMWLGGWSADYPDPDNFLRLGVRRWTRATWQDEAYLELVERARQITDQAQRMVLYEQADRIAIAQAAILPLIHARVHLLVKPWVKKNPMSPMRHWFWKDVVIDQH
jgi:ABC-type oligopeptide transport system substrate-binding subunit